MLRAAFAHHRRMRPPRKLPPELGDAPFRTADASDAGVTPGQLRTPGLATPFHGVRSLSAPRTTLERCLAYAPKLKSNEFFSHLTAADLYEVPLPRSLRDLPDIHVSVIAPAFPPRAAGVIGHRLSQAKPLFERGSLRALQPAEVWAQLGAFLSHEQLVIAGDFLVRRKRPLSTVAALTSSAATGSGRGIRAVRAALKDVRRGTDSPRETTLRLLIIRAGLPEPAIGHTILGPAGNFIATPDLCYVAERIAIEYEGDIHRTDPRVYEDDIIRRELIEEAGWIVIRVINEHIRNQPHRLTDRIATALRERAVGT